MSYYGRIATLQESLNLLNQRIASLYKDPKNTLFVEAVQQKTTLEREISRLQRLQWEEDHERVDLDD